MSVSHIVTKVDTDQNEEITIESGDILQRDEVLEEFLIRTRRLLIVGEINDVMSAYICSYLQLFSEEKKPVYIYINSPGGCLASGYAIIDQMLTCNYPVYTIVRGQGYSMGAVIAAFGTKGCRYATRNSSLMLHSVVVQNVSESIERHGKMTKYIEDDYNRKMADIARRSKLTKKQLTKLMDDTSWMSPNQAVKIGIIDGIWTPRMEQSIALCKN